MRYLKSGFRIYLTFFLIAFPLFIFAARDTFQDDRPNDTTSAYYLCYGRNINRYSIATTKLLNIDLVGHEGKPLFGEGPVTFYRDHPPLLTWSVALALKVKDIFASSGSDLIAARMVNILASIGILLLTMHVCRKAFGTSSAIIAGIAILSCPIFFSHGVVVNFEPLCCCLILLGFMGTSPFLFLPALLADWPAFFALPVYSYFELKEGNWKRAFIALLMGFFIGAGTLVTYGYLTGHPQFALSFIKSTASFETERYVFHTAELFQEARAIARLMVVMNFGFLNCLVVLIACSHWLKNHSTLNKAQMIGLSSVIVTVTNIVLFHSWAAGHSFWSYYLLPAVAIAYADLIQKKHLRVVLILFLGLNLLYSGNLFVKQLLRHSPRSSAEEKAPLLLDTTSEPIFTDNRHVYFGHGYVARWYFDRPLEVVPSPYSSSVRNSCSEQPCIWISENNSPIWSRKDFDVWGTGRFGNVYITRFQAKPL